MVIYSIYQYTKFNKKMHSFFLNKCVYCKSSYETYEKYSFKW